MPLASKKRSPRVSPFGSTLGGCGYVSRMEQRSGSTLAGIGEQSRGGLWVGRAVLGALALVVFAAAAGLLGVHTTEESASGDGYRLTVEYPRTARSGLDTLWQVTVNNPGGFDQDVRLTVTADYFDIFESQGFFPDPDTQTRDGDLLYLTFTKPPGDTFMLGFDAYIQPSSQIGRDAEVAVLNGASDDVAASVHIDTWLAP